MLVWTSGSPCKVSLWRDYIFLPYLKYSSRILAQVCYQEAAVLGLERMQLLIIRMWMTIKPSFPLHTSKWEDYKSRTHQCFFLLPHECILLFFQRQSKCSCISRDEVARIQYSSISLVWWITITLKCCDDVCSFQFIFVKEKRILERLGMTITPADWRNMKIGISDFHHTENVFSAQKLGVLTTLQERNMGVWSSCCSEDGF